MEGERGSGTGRGVIKIESINKLRATTLGVASYPHWRKMDDFGLRASIQTPSPLCHLMGRKRPEAVQQVQKQLYTSFIHSFNETFFFSICLGPHVMFKNKCKEGACPHSSEVPCMAKRKIWKDPRFIGPGLSHTDLGHVRPQKFPSN